MHYSTEHEIFTIDEAAGVGQIDWRASKPPFDAHLKTMDDHFLGARLLGPCKPWVDDVASTNEKGSPGSVHAIVSEALLPWIDVGPSLYANANTSLARPANFTDGQVCWTGGQPVDGKCPQAPIYAWDPQHEFRGLRHLLAFRRFGWPSDGYLAGCAINRVLHEPRIMEGTSDNQREYGWPLLLLTESLSTLLGQHPSVPAGLNKLIDVLWGKHGSNNLTLNIAAGPDHGYLLVCSWQHAVLTRALGRLVRRGWNDPRVAQLYKIGMKVLDQMREPGTYTWWKDWDPITGDHLEAATPYMGTSLWTACAYAESLSVLTAGADFRKSYLIGFMEESDAMKPAHKYYDPAAHALLSKLVA